MALSWTMDKVGPLGRSAQDCGLVLSAIAGADPLDPSTVQGRFEYPTRTLAQRRYRLGILRGTRDKIQPGVLQNFDASVAALGEFADLVDDLELPDFPYAAAARVVVEAEAASAFEPLFESGRITELTAPEDRIGGYAGQALLAKDYLRALRVRRPAALALDQLLAGVDALLAPSRPTVASPLDKPWRTAYPDYPGGTNISAAANLCGVPALFLMNGLGEAGLPTSLQLTGRALSEEILLAIGIRYQERTGFHRLRPPGL
jgi:aspartyl-tRNA(Asn)/glutamyl-tRNA(Gln) amidotransferase subunit A